MFLLKSAWDNIRFHGKRSMLSIALIAIASGTILLYRGFVEYSEQGMAIGFIETSGHIQISRSQADGTRESEALLTAADLDSLKLIIAKTPHVSTYDAVLRIQGIIGAGECSSIFWGAGYDAPQKFGATSGTPVFAGERGLVVGKGLFEALKLDSAQQNSVTLMSSVGRNGIRAGSFDVTGYLDTGMPQNDAGFVAASRSALIDLFELEDSASYIRLFLQKDSDMPAVQAYLDRSFAEHGARFQTKNWKTLNPSWEQVSSLFHMQFTVISGILCVLIFVALTQSLSASFMERIGEFGTMEAIGLKKSSLIGMLVLEICLLSLAGIIGGILLAQSGAGLTEILDITMTPPGYSKGYRLNFYISAAEILRTQCFIFLTTVVSGLYPIYTIRKYGAVQLIHFIRW